MAAVQHIAKWQTYYGSLFLFFCVVFISSKQTRMQIATIVVALTLTVRLKSPKIINVT